MAPPPPTPADIARGLAPLVPLGGLVAHASPPLSDAQLVGFPTWLWLTGWTPRTTSLLGVVVTATPVRADWSLVDASTSCDGPGEPYRPGDDAHRAGGASDCSVTFTHDSHDRPDGRFHGDVTVTWRVTWRAGAAAGTLPDRAVAQPVVVRVRSLVAVTD